MRLALLIIILGLLFGPVACLPGQVSFQQGSAGAALPPFGGFVPGQGATISFGGRGGSLTVAADQGSTRSLVSQSASVTVANGGSGAIFSGTLRPFVTGYVPVVSSYDMAYAWYPYKAQAFDAANAWCGQNAFFPPNANAFVPQVNDGTVDRQQVTEARRAAAIQRLIERAERAQRAGQIQMAKRYYAMAARRATDEMKAELEGRILKLGE